MRILLLALTLLLAACGHGAGTAVATGSPFDRKIAAGEEALAKGKPDEAIRHLQRAVDLRPRSALAHRKLVEAYVRLGRGDEVIAAYRKILAARDDPFARYALALGLYASSATQAAEALSQLRAAEKTLPEEGEFPFRQGMILLDQEQFGKAIERFERAMALAPKRAAYRVPLALAYHHAGQQQKSMKVLNDLLSLSPSAAEIEKARQVANSVTGRFVGIPEVARARFDQAIAWLEKADVPQNAIDLLRDILLEFPDLGMVHALLGLSYQRIKSGGEALVHFRRAVELSPDAALPSLYLGNFYASRQRRIDAARAYEDALQKNPLLLAPHQMLAEMATQAGDDERAETHLQAWILLSRRATYPRLTLARLFTRHGRIDEADAELQEVLALSPGNIEAHLGLAAISVHRFEKATTKGSRKIARQQAEEHLKVVVEEQPGNAAAKALRRHLDG